MRLLGRTGLLLVEGHVPPVLQHHKHTRQQRAQKCKGRKNGTDGQLSDLELPHSPFRAPSSCPRCTHVLLHVSEDLLNGNLLLHGHVLECPVHSLEHVDSVVGRADRRQLRLLVSSLGNLGGQSSGGGSRRHSPERGQGGDRRAELESGAKHPGEREREGEERGS